MNNQPAENMQRVSFTLPAGPLIALLEPQHRLADTKGALALGLIEDGKPTALGKLVMAGVDQVTIRHVLINADKGR